MLALKSRNSTAWGNLSLPEDAGYATLGGYVLSILGRIPETGQAFEQNGVNFTVLDAV